MSKPDSPLAPLRITSSKIDSSTASISLRWIPPSNTGGVALTGFKLYGSDLTSNSGSTLIYDGTNAPEVIEYVASGLTIDHDYEFYVTALNPYESLASAKSVYRLAGFPDTPS